MSNFRPALLLVALVSAGTPAAAQGVVVPVPLCGTRPTPPPVWDHVVWIWFENHSYGDIIGSHDAPFMNKRLARGCGLATNYHSFTHPSLPNYIAATSGLALDALGPLRDNCNATGNCHTGAPSIFSAAPSWGAYAESMPRPCTHWFFGSYAASHNPAVYYRNLADCGQHALNLAALWRDLDADRLPAFVFVTPNLCHSMHSCSVGSGDGWLRHVIYRLAASPAYQRGTMAVVVTFDESATDDSSEHIATLVVSPSTPPRTRSAKAFTHYSLLRTTEEMLGVEPLLAQAAHAASMRSAFNL
ncbi:MAG TPA: alkaline phosphatase family protein [Chloroflexota bacterium]|nr:alkaline phosphatase family protein [Chloroflexota bacterium]